MRSANKIMLIGAVAIAAVLLSTMCGEETIESVSAEMNKPENTAILPEVALLPLATSVRPEISLKDFELYFGIKDHFDAFLNRQDSLEFEVLLEKYRNYLRQEQFSLEAIKQASDLFARYIDYKKALTDLDREYGAQKELLAVESKLLQLQDIRTQYFDSEEYKYLFSEDATFDEHALARLRIAADPQMKKDDKLALINEHLLGLPEGQRQSFQPSMDIETIKHIQQASSNDNTRYNSAAAALNHEVAERLNVVWREQSVWQNRVNDFLTQRETLLQSESSSESEKQNLLAQLMQDNFSENEKKRLLVYIENPQLLKK